MAFNSCRIPIPGSDVAYIYHGGDKGPAEHIVAMRRGRFFKISATVPENDGKSRMLSVAELAHQFRNAVSLADLDASNKYDCALA